MKNANSGSANTAEKTPLISAQIPVRNAETVIVTPKRERGMGRSPYPLCAASAAGSALGLAEDGKAQSHQTGADEQRQNGIGGHDVPDITDQRSQRTGVTKDGSNGGGSSSLGSALLS